MRNMYDAQALINGMDDVKAGRVVYGASALKELNGKYVV